MFDVFISVESSFFVGREPLPVFRRRTAISGMLLRDSLFRQDILSCLRIPYQNQIPSRPGCGIAVGLSSFYSQGLSPRTGTGLMGFSPGGYDVLSGRQIATVVSALAKASHVLAIDGHDKGQILPKIRDPVNEHVT